LVTTTSSGIQVGRRLKKSGGTKVACGVLSDVETIHRKGNTIVSAPTIRTTWMGIFLRYRKSVS
jgi:hypothetical protein